MEKKEKKRRKRRAREKRREEGLNRRGGQASGWQLAAGNQLSRD